MYEQESSTTIANNNVMIPIGQIIGNKDLNDFTISGFNYEAGVSLPEFLNEERRESCKLIIN